MKKGKNNSLRIVALILAMIMAVGVFPMQAFADDAEAGSAVVVPSETKEQQTETNNFDPADNSGEAAEPGQEADPADTADNEAEPAEDNTGSEQPAAADYTFPQATVYLKDIFEALGISFKNNSVLSADTDLIFFSETELKNKNYESITLTATGSFELATLSIEDNKSTRTITLSYTSPDDPQLVDNGALYANDDLYITGKIPGNGVIEVLPVTVAIDGQEVLAAYDINIYANSRQQSKGSTWQPADEKVTVHFKDDAFANTRKVNVYHVADESADPEYVTTVKPVDSWITFEAESFSVYVFTKVIEKTVEINGSTYKISVSYDADAKIPDGAELEVTEVPADNYLADVQTALGMQEGDSFLYNKFLDISIVKDGSKIEPASEVTVSVELLDVEGPAEALSVVHFGASGPERITETTVENGVLSFETDSFSIFNFGIITGTLLDMLTEYMSVAVVGIKSLYAQYAETALTAVEEGLEVLEAYNVSASGLLASLTSLVVKVRLKTALTLGALEDVIVYGIKDGRLSSILYTGLGTSEQQLNIDGFDGFALVRDTGFRRRELSLGNILLGGLVPKNATATAEDVLETIGDVSFAATGENDTVSAIAAYDISIQNGASEYQPTPGQPVTVTITNDAIGAAIDAGKSLSLWHIKDNHIIEEVKDFSVTGNTVSFDATGFSVYIIVDHEGDNTVVTPRFTVHFLSPVTDIATQQSVVNGQYFYTVSNYSFVNKALTTQCTQIVQNGETLELIANPPNQAEKFFYGWYIVAMDSVSGNQVTFHWTASPKPLAFETPITITDNNDGTFTMMWTAVDGTTYTETSEVDFGSSANPGDYSAHIYVAPIYEDYCYVNFHELAYTVSNNSNLLTRKLVILGSDGVEAVRVNDIVAPATDTVRRIFRGWQYRTNNTWISVQTIDDNGNTIERSINVTGDIDLYPYFQEGRWLYFNVGESGNGAKYVPAQFVLAEFDSEAGGTSIGGQVTSLPTTTRVGYDFGGWQVVVGGTESDPIYAVISDADGNILSSFEFKDKDGNSVSAPAGQSSSLISVNGTYEDNDGNEQTGTAYSIENGTLTIKYPLSALTFYARWTEKANSKITIVIWKQKINDAVDATNADKHYDYYALDVASLPTVIENIHSGQTLSDLNSTLSPYRGLASNTNTKDDFTGFQLRASDPVVMSDERVRGDGSTVVNIYYDRSTYSIKFYTNGYKNTEIPELRITALFGQDIHDQWPGVRPGTESYSTMWNLDNSTYVSGVNSMPVNGGSYYRYTGSGYGYNTVFMVEPISGSNNASDYTSWVEHPFQFNSQDLRTGTEDYTPIEGFRLNAASQSDATSIRNDAATKGCDPYAVYDPSKPTSAALSTYYYTTNGYYGHTGYGVMVNGYSTLYFYYLRNSYTLTFDYNYPVAATDGMSDAQKNKTIDKENIPYQTDLSKYGKNGSENVWVTESDIPDHYEFKGWFEDAAGTIPFDFTTTMPAADKIIYGKWEPLYYTVTIDPNGGVIDHINYTEPTDGQYDTFYLEGFNADHSSKPQRVQDAWVAALDAVGNDTSWISDLTGAGHITAQSTYFNALYGTAIGEYELDRTYVEYDGTDDGTKLYYVNMQFNSTSGEWGLHADLRNALYLTETQLQAYYKYCLAVKAWHDVIQPGYYDGTLPSTYAEFKDLYVNKNEQGEFILYELVASGSYAFVGWYVVNPDGTLSENPYNFANAVEEDLALRAVWRRIGSYYISYDPVYRLSVNGEYVVVNGQITAWTDPANVNDEKYNDGAPTTLLQQPTGIQASDGGTEEDYIFRGWRVVKITGYTNGYPDYVALSNRFYDQAAPFNIDASYADDTGCIHMQAVYQPVNASDRRPEIANLILDANGGYLTDGATPANELTASADITTASGWNRVGTVFADFDEQEIVFGRIQSNDAVHLMRYAVANGTFANYTSKLYFKHPNNYFLIGFDNLPDESDYIATYPADAVISVQRTDEEEIYAVWEPMVYITFKNRTKEPVSFELSGTGQALRIVNEVTGVFSREAYTGTTVTLAPGEQIKFVMPEGGGEYVTVTGENGSTSQLLTITSYSEHELPANKINETYAGMQNRSASADFTVKNQLIDSEYGILVFFDGLDTVFFDTNGSQSVPAVWTDTARTGNAYDTVLANNALIYVDEDGLPYEIKDFVNDTNIKITKPSDPTRTGYVFVGWTADRDAAMSDPTGYTLPGTDSASNINNLAVIKNSLLWDFDTEITEGMTLYAVWSELVTVKFHYINGTHRWMTQTVSDYYVGPTSGTGNDRYYTVTLAKGDKVILPVSPEWNNQHLFYRWVNVNTYQNTTSTVGSIPDANIFDFGTPIKDEILVNGNLDLYTSWVEASHIDVTVTKTVDSTLASDKDRLFSFTAVITTTTYTGTARYNWGWSASLNSNQPTTTTETQTFTLRDSQSNGNMSYTFPLYFKDSDTQTIYRNSNPQSGTFTVFFQSVTITETSDPDFTVTVNGSPANTYSINTKGSGNPSFNSPTGNTRQYTLSSNAAYSNTNPTTVVPVAFTNTRAFTDVTVTKVVTSDDYLTGSEKFAFTATYKDSSNNTVTPPAAAGYTVSGTTASFELGDGETVILRGVPIGGSVTVTETSGGFTVDSKKDTAANYTENAPSITLSGSDISVDGAGVTFRNSRITYDATITNTVSYYGSKTKSFVYTAVLKNSNDEAVVFPTGLVTAITKTSTGSAAGTMASLSSDRKTLTFALRDDERCLINDLPGGYKLVVTQASEEDYITASREGSNAFAEELVREVSLVADKQIDYKNTLKTGSYTVTKNVLLPTGTLPNNTAVDFLFTAKLLATAGATTPVELINELKATLPAGVTVNATNTIMSFTLTINVDNSGVITGDSITLPGLPVGYFLQVTENAPGYAAYVNSIRTDSVTAQVAEGINSDISFINRKADSVLRIRKVDDEDGTPITGGSFNLSRKISATDYQVVFALIADADGYLYYDEAGVTNALLSLENGTYRLTEVTAPDGYKPLSGYAEFVVNNSETNDADRIQITNNASGAASILYDDVNLRFEMTVENERLLIAPTGIDFDNIPFVMMAILGLLLCLIAVFGKKARREEMALAAGAVEAEVEAAPEEKSAQITEASAKAEAVGKRPRKPMQAIQGCREWAGCVWHASKECMRFVRRRIRSGPYAPPG